MQTVFHYPWVSGSSWRLGSFGKIHFFSYRLDSPEKVGSRETAGLLFEDRMRAAAVGEGD